MCINFLYGRSLLESQFFILFISRREVVGDALYITMGRPAGQIAFSGTPEKEKTAILVKETGQLSTNQLDLQT